MDRFIKASISLKRVELMAFPRDVNDGRNGTDGRKIMKDKNGRKILYFRHLKN
jgi:hypothetical protein